MTVGITRAVRAAERLLRVADSRPGRPFEAQFNARTAEGVTHCSVVLSLSASSQLFWLDAKFGSDGSAALICSAGADAHPMVETWDAQGVHKGEVGFLHSPGNPLDWEEADMSRLVTSFLTLVSPKLEPVPLHALQAFSALLEHLLPHLPPGAEGVRVNDLVMTVDLPAARRRGFPAHARFVWSPERKGCAVSMPGPGGWKGGNEPEVSRLFVPRTHLGKHPRGHGLKPLRRGEGTGKAAAELFARVDAEWAEGRPPT